MKQIVMCVILWAWLISGTDELSKSDNDFLYFYFFYVVSSFFNPLNY